MQPVLREPRLDIRGIACRAFGVHLLSDIHERGCEWRLPLPIGPARRGRIDRIVEAGLLFVHIPKAAGMSISHALYGFQIKHASIRLSRSVAGGRLARLPSFAVFREPTERFLSAWRYSNAGGSAVNDVAEPFRDLYRGFATIDDALDHIEAANGPYAIDHIFRPQSWYVTDAGGRIAVDRLLTTRDIPRLPALVPGFPDRAVPQLNGSRPGAIALTASQRARLHRFYAADYLLWDEICAGGTVYRATPAAATLDPPPVDRVPGFGELILQH